MLDEILIEKNSLTGFNESELALHNELKEIKKSHGVIQKAQIKFEKKITDKEFDISSLNSNRISVEAKIRHSNKKLEQANASLASNQLQLDTKSMELSDMVKEAKGVKKAFKSFENDVKAQTEQAGLQFSTTAQKEYTEM